MPVEIPQEIAQGWQDALETMEAKRLTGEPTDQKEAEEISMMISEELLAYLRGY